ncbi:MAG TPA: methyl-accepting chemotaxis protein [Burkholderiaceae bacterium]|nr:methyl-accepting chemotaxis protein [Burkholderiaceae bacterium]
MKTTLLSRWRGRLARMGVGRQLYAAFTLSLVLTAAVGALALDGLARVDAQSAALADKWLRGVGLLADIRNALVEVRDNEVKHGRTGDSSYHAEYEEKIGASSKLVATALAQYQALPAADAERALLGKFTKGWGDYQAAERRVVELGRAKKQQDAADISDGAASMAFDETMGALNKLTQYGFDGGKQAAVDVSVIYTRGRLWVAGLLGAALVLGMGMAWAITRHLLRQLGGEPLAAAAVAKAVAEGDLTSTIALKAGDERSLMFRLASMQQALAAAVTDVRRGSENVARASAEIAHGNHDLSSRTEQQASALQETAATMDELGATVRNNADNAKQANQLALGASTVAVKGGAVVEQVVQTMKGINDSSRKIADIIGTIDGIAFQTNILALNAAVEAARAGEQGRGFAVVAAEVRSLAQRSAAAAKEIKTLIQASVERVGQGSELVDQAGRTMTEIVDAIKRVTDIVGEISAASTEQSAGVAQVGQAVTQMDHATQRNAALVEQSAAAAASMTQQAQELVQAVAVFKLAQATAARTAPATPVASAPVVPAPRAPAMVAKAPVAKAPVAPAAPAAPAAPVERRGPNRATNVARIKVEPRAAAPAPAPRIAATAAAAAPSSDEWESF